LANEFNGQEPLNDIIPYWVVDLMLRNKLPPIKDPTISFFLGPDKSIEKPLPSLPHGSVKLSANKFLRVAKVTVYVVNKLNLKLTDIEPVDYIEILCNNEVITPETSLATVKKFYWKSSEEVMLKYRISSKHLKAK